MELSRRGGEKPPKGFLISGYYASLPKGHNPQYLFFDSWEFTNAPGGISNGITSGFRDEEDIDFNLTIQTDRRR